MVVLPFVVIGVFPFLFLTLVSLQVFLEFWTICWLVVRGIGVLSVEVVEDG